MRIVCSNYKIRKQAREKGFFGGSFPLPVFTGGGGATAEAKEIQTD